MGKIARGIYWVYPGGKIDWQEDARVVLPRDIHFPRIHDSLKYNTRMRRDLRRSSDENSFTIVHNSAQPYIPRLIYTYQHAILHLNFKRC